MVSKKVLLRIGVGILYIAYILAVIELSLHIGGVVYRQLHGREGSFVEPSAYVILAIGESTTYGVGVEKGKSYPELIERILRTDYGINVTVVNMAFPGQTSTSIMRSIDSQINTYRPDVVISLFGFNIFEFLEIAIDI